MGRWYLVCVDVETKTALRLRIKDIAKHKVTSQKFLDGDYLLDALTHISHTYLSTAVSPPVLVEAQFLVPENSPIFQQFKREIFVGEITQNEHGVFSGVRARPDRAEAPASQLLPLSEDFAGQP